MTNINADLVLPQCEMIPQRIEKNLVKGLKKIDEVLSTKESVFLLKLLRLIPISTILLFANIALRYSKALNTAMLTAVQLSVQTLTTITLIAGIILTLDAYFSYFDVSVDVRMIVKKLIG